MHRWDASTVTLAIAAILAVGLSGCGQPPAATEPPAPEPESVTGRPAAEPARDIQTITLVIEGMT